MPKPKRTSDEKIIAALLQCGSYQEAAKALGTSKQAISTRMENADFKQRYEDAKTSFIDEVVNGMKIRCGEAVNTLTEIMKDKSNPATVRVSAADSILRHTLRYVEAAELKQIKAKIEALEARENENV